MPKTEFGAAVEEARSGLDAGMPERTNRRLRARLGGGPGPKRRLRRGRVAGAAGSVLALALIATVGLRGSGGPDPLGGFALLEPSAGFASTVSADGVTVLSGRCVLSDEALGSRLEVEGPAVIQRLADGVALAAGTIELDVDHEVVRAVPFRVRVSHGQIEVLGTRFLVVQREGGGEVALERGSIRFRADDGRVRMLTPGQSLSWPLPPEELTLVKPEPDSAPQPERRPPPPTPRPTPVAAEPRAVAKPVAEAPFDAAALLERIAVLRSRGQFEEAVTALTGALRERHGTATDERLSFELGAILTRQLNDPPRACGHWRAHQQTFPTGRYETEVTQARQQLHCPE